MSFYASVNSVTIVVAFSKDHGLQHQAYYSVSPTASVQRRSLVVAWVLLLLTLQLGIFNPVGCLIHCLPHAHAAPVAPAPFAFFCLVPEQYHPISHEAPSTPAAMHAASAPQAAYAFVLIALGLMTLLASARVQPLRDRMILVHHCEPPLVPPPQAL